MPLKFIQLELPLFAPPTFDEILQRDAIKDLTVECSNRLRSSWRVECRPFSKKRTLFVPRLLEQAPEQVKRDLIEWALLPLGRRLSGASRHKKRIIERSVWQYLKEHGIEPAGTRRVDPRHYELAGRGVKYDLNEIYRSVNETYFNGKIHTYIRWGSYASTTSYQTFRRDAAGNRFSLITIAGAYNHPRVPRFALEAVVYHEMLHVAIPATRGRLRNVIHGPEFKRAERAFPEYRKWRAWEKHHLRGIIRSLRLKRIRGEA